MSKLILVGNWKNHPSSLSEASKLLNGLSKRGSIYRKLSTFIAPPLPYLETVSKRVKKIGSLASQDIFFTPVLP
ncbi:triose-phosphate isomerase, partial [Candidatus Parcubacteria bacterium]|nr:triose-phosphate isomerase [Candidatus Parcubacteria bacterium]